MWAKRIEVQRKVKKRNGFFEKVLLDYCNIVNELVNNGFTTQCSKLQNINENKLSSMNAKQPIKTHNSTLSSQEITGTQTYKDRPTPRCCLPG